MYLFTDKVWQKLYVGGNGTISYGLKATNPDFKPKSGRCQFWNINDHVFRAEKAAILDFYDDFTEQDYDRLLVELDKLPTHA